MYTALTAILSLVVLLIAPTQTHAGPFSKRATVSPILGGANFPDPAIIKGATGWHLFSTDAKINGKWIHVQRAFTSDFKSFSLRTGVDALPSLPAWVDSLPRVWAPDVVKAADGTFVMYYTAALKSHPNLHCLSFATANTLADVFVDRSSAPWICPTAQGGAIDIAGFTDENNGGKRWVVYKVDGNAIGHGGSCGNTVAPIVPTPILLQQVSGDGHTKIGSPIQILTNIAVDGPYVEAPSLTRMGGKYVLFFSSQCYQTSGYDVKYAVADAITGPYTRMGKLLQTGDFGLVAPGGLDISINGDKAVWHAYVHMKGEAKRKCRNFESKADCARRNHGSGRAAYVGSLTIKGNVVSVAV
jgi:beta-xylosidase